MIAFAVNCVSLDVVDCDRTRQLCFAFMLDSRGSCDFPTANDQAMCESSRMPNNMQIWKETLVTIRRIEVHSALYI